jgi:hypothetical protein
MEVNVTYHWTYLDYEAPAYKKSTTWGPVANISIDAKVELPFARDGHIFVNYDRISCVIDSNDDPRDQIVRYIQHYAEVKGIEVHFDFLERWEKKPLNDSGWTGDFDF